MPFDALRSLSLLGLQRIVWVRPPEASLRRGLVALPPGPTVAVALLALATLLGLTLHRRFRRRGSSR